MASQLTQSSVSGTQSRFRSQSQLQFLQLDQSKSGRPGVTFTLMITSEALISWDHPKRKVSLWYRKSVCLFALLSVAVVSGFFGGAIKIKLNRRTLRSLRRSTDQSSRPDTNEYLDSPRKQHPTAKKPS